MAWEPGNLKTDTNSYYNITLKAGKNFGTVRRQRKFVKKFAAVTVIVG